MVARQHQGQEAGCRFARPHEFFTEFLDEHRRPKLVGNGHVVGRKRARRVGEHRRRERVIDGVHFTADFHGRIAETPLLFGGEPKIVERNAVAVEVFPHRAVLVVVFGVKRARGIYPVPATRR